MAPFAIHWMRTQRGKESAGYESRTHPGHGYAFIFRHHNKEFNQYRCTKCRKVYNQNRKDNLKIPVPPAAIRVFGNQFLSDPDQLPHICMENGPTDDTLWAKILEKGSKNK
jgi:hypothetical protein